MFLQIIYGLIFLLIYIKKNYITGNIENVVIVHCLAGKGRTGTIICCYMLFCGLFKTPEEALAYYSRKRSVTKEF
jgi:phosphatidylinositol-3,4,5-trisphosphate 3-phosphatase/dual-specificity protein phosphatase PTEN